MTNYKISGMTVRRIEDMCNDVLNNYYIENIRSAIYRLYGLSYAAFISDVPDRFNGSLYWTERRTCVQLDIIADINYIDGIEFDYDAEEVVITDLNLFIRTLYNYYYLDTTYQYTEPGYEVAMQETLSAWVSKYVVIDDIYKCMVTGGSIIFDAIPAEGLECYDGLCILNAISFLKMLKFINHNDRICIEDNNVYINGALKFRLEELKNTLNDTIDNGLRYRFKGVLYYE